jgi:pimeloyl-ACP methyl ester carboxylesterase
MIAMMLIAAAAAAIFQPQFVDNPCSDANLAKIARCGSVEVPENRAEPTGHRILLNIIVLRAASSAPHLPPLFDIDGGPGLAVTKNVGFYLVDGAAYRLRRDVVMIDQRGTGRSRPLSCVELGSPATAYLPLYPSDAVARCRKALETESDLTHYLTQDAVEDLDAVRAALGYEKIDLQGLSYGTTVALRYLATHPDRVRAAVLMGVAPPSLMPPARHAPAADRALRLLFAECAADTKCTKVFQPDAELERALSRLSAQKGAPSREVFLEKIRSMLYQPMTARQIPWVIHRAAAGDLSSFYEITRPSGQSPYFDGMFLSVVCSEAMALMDFDKAAAASRATRFGDYRLQRQRNACSEWTTGKAAPDFLAPVAAPAAVLLISGELDPVTPPELAQDVADALPNARHVIIPKSGHVFDGLSGIDTCFDPLVVKFLDTADLTTLDPSCLAEMRPPPFKTSAVAAGAAD